MGQLGESVVEVAQVVPVPSNPEIDSAKLVLLDAGFGEFFVCRAGARREVMSIVFYADEAEQFFFFANALHSPEAGRWVEVCAADRLRLGGAPYKISAPRRATIENNVTYLFRERAFLRLSEPLSPADRPDRVVFTWKIGP